ncbi:MAG: glycine cleavage system aminomethyltransferase GcvT [Puniceicoccales bacterium]|jgi:aminomethyltransferase|nr:glycine cleavage system aminomethyltransferase GcvT [Puniceicoccales bacterium]
MSDAPTQRTPLYDFHVRHGARMVPFAGWEMPVQYTAIIEEHMAVREKAGLFDVSHMGEARVTGPDAARFLDRVMTNSYAGLKVGMAKYTIMCQPDGGCVDDLIVYRLGEEEFLICLNAGNAPKDVAWLQEQSKGFNVTVADECKQWAQVALQGPLAEEILAKVTPVTLSGIKRFGFAVGSVAGVDGCIISRTGYTGSPGFEVYMPATGAEKVAEGIFVAGKDQGLKLAGLGCRDSLRLEACYPLYGHEISEKINPLQANLGWTIKFDKPTAFIGQTALLEQKAQGLSSKVIFFKLDDRRIARQGAPIYNGDVQVGEVLSGTLSPCLNKPIGSALVKVPDVEQPNLAVDIRGNRIPMIVVNEPFYK